MHYIDPGDRAASGIIPRWSGLATSGPVGSLPNQLLRVPLRMIRRTAMCLVERRVVGGDERS